MVVRPGREHQAAIPGVGTVTAVLATGGETALFLAAGAFYTLAVAEVYGMPVEDVERRRESAYILVQVRRHALPRLSKTRVQKERRGWAACLTGWHGVRIQTHPRIEPLGPCKSLKNAAQKVHDPGRIRSAAAHIEHGILGEDVQGHGHVGVQAFGVFW